MNASRLWVWQTVVAVCLLATLTLAVFWPVTDHDFINYDDPLYVTQNPYIQAGLTWEGLAWAFGRLHGNGTYWHPLTWVSHMVDCELYGSMPWGHHLTSVLFHAANAVLVFLVFLQMTGAFWRCAVLAGLFALHPLQVDSVAWVAERKNLLSAFFWLLTTWAYVSYAESRKHSTLHRAATEGGNPEGGIPNPESSHAQHTPSPSPSSLLPPHPSFFYGLSLVLFALGLMCKPVLVTLPFVLLLLDYWPLHRFELDTQRPILRTLLPLVREKVPFVALAVASSAVTVLAHHTMGFLVSVSRLPWDTRLENALVSYGRYLGKMFWPGGLAVLYPYPAAWPMREVVACGLLLFVITGLVLGTARSRPWLLVGWCWFLGVLVPFIGLIQAGAQAMADRFMYVPSIGIMVAVIWGLERLAEGGRYPRLGLWAAGSAAILLCLVSTRQQLGHWKDSETLFRHALEVTDNNYIAHVSLGYTLEEKGQVDEAISQYQEAIRIKPDYASTHYNLGNVLCKKGQIDEAIHHYREAIRLKLEVSRAQAHYNLGLALARKGQVDEAISHYQAAIRLEPDYAKAHYDLASLLLQKGRLEEAIRYLQQALSVQPDYAEAHNNLGIALYGKGRTDEAIYEFQEAVRLKPDYAEARKNLDLVLATQAGTPPQPSTPTHR
jgi:protein O-mannosyl-transferase